jgi:hypothetical protein
MITGVSASTAGPRPHLAARIAAGILALAVVAAIWYRQTYSVWPGQEASARVHWCGRNYESSGGSAKTWPQVTSPGRLPVRPVAKYPPLGLSRQELFAAVPPVQRSSVSPPPPCPATVYLRIGPNDYRSYSLQGSGP